MEEEWKVYKTTMYHNKERIYEVSNFGSVKLNGEFVDFSNQTGYYGIAGFYIHRAVAELFIPNPENKPQVDHIDTNIHNNRFDNLRWVTHKENCNNPLTRKHNSEAQNRPETKQKQSKSQKEAQNRPEVNQKRSKSMKEVMNRPEIRQKQSETMKEIWSNPEYRQKQSEVMKGKNKGKPCPIKGKHRVYNDPDDHTAGHHYE